MSQQDYASTDLKRRPFRSTLMMITLTCVVATTTFLFLFGNILLDVTSVLTSGGLSSALGVFFQSFIWATLILVLLLGGVVVSSTISLEMVSRRKDIGLMKSIGTLMDTIFDHFMAQALILLVGGTVLGVVFGLALYLGGLLWLSSVLPAVRLTFEFPWLQLGLVVIIYLFAGYLAAQKPIYDAVHESPITTMNPELGSRVRKSGFLDSFGLPFKVATKATGRRISGSRRTMVSLFLSISLAAMLWIGGGIIETTTDAYIVRSMGQNVVAIGNPTLLNEYYSAYSLSGTLLDESFSYLNSSDLVPSDLVEEFLEMPGVVRVEQRLVDFAPVIENPAIVWNPTTEMYERIGEDRTDSALIVGLEWGSTISDWYFEGSQVNGSQQAWIGGELATGMFVDPLIQSIDVGGSSLAVRAIAFEILNGGKTAFMSLAEMQSAWGIDGVNLVLVQLDEYSETLISQISGMASTRGLGIYLQEDVLQGNLATVSAFWFLLQPLPIMAIISAFLSLMNYLLVSVFGRFRDYVIMRSIGAAPSFVAKTMIAEGVAIGFGSGIPSIAFATIFSVYLLVPEAAVPSVLYLPLAIVTMLLSLVLVVIIAAVPVYLIFNSGTDLRVSEFSV
ncbi:MAG: ABC transporter permease [Candidatus Thorarchaeota archaeon]|nr:MAG: ABC transporter permease [Candidatus Thorarchaeota archaeon]